MLKVKYFLLCVFSTFLVNNIEGSFFSFLANKNEGQIIPIIIKYDAFKNIKNSFTTEMKTKIIEYQNDLAILQSGNPNTHIGQIYYYGRPYSLLVLERFENTKNVNKKEINKSLNEAIDLFWGIAAPCMQMDILPEDFLKPVTIREIIKIWFSQRSSQLGISKSFLLEWANRGIIGEAGFNYMKLHITSFYELNIFVKEFYYFLNDFIYTIDSYVKRDL